MNAVDWINSQQTRVREKHREMWDAIKRCFEATFLIWMVKNGKTPRAEDIALMSVIYTRFHAYRKYEKLKDPLKYDEKAFNKTLTMLEKSLMSKFSDERFPFPGLPDDAFEILQKVLAVEHVGYTCIELLVISAIGDDLPPEFEDLNIPDLWSLTRLKQSKMIQPLIMKIGSGSLGRIDDIPSRGMLLQNGIKTELKCEPGQLPEITIFSSGKDVEESSGKDIIHVEIPAVPSLDRFFDVWTQGFNRGSETATKNPPGTRIHPATRPRKFQPILLSEPTETNQTESGLSTTLKDFVNEKDDSTD